jgi:N-acetylmuramoyl-L-alanine amidase
MSNAGRPALACTLVERIADSAAMIKGIRLPLVFACLILALAGRIATAEPLAAVHIAGKPYARLADWAAANGLTVHPSRGGQILQLDGRSSNLSFEADSREARINGATVYLCSPAVAREGELYVAQLDLESTLKPLISPPKNWHGNRIHQICLDPGHGGNDPGLHSGPNQEKKYTLLLAQELRQQLSRSGFAVSLTRETDSSLDLNTRSDLARRRKADLFVSLHFNSTETSAGNVRGSEVYCLTPVGASSTNARGQGAGAGRFPGNQLDQKNILLAHEVQKSLTHGLGAEDRGVRRARFAVLREATMPAVLIEAGYLSNPTEGKRILDPNYRKQMARAIADGLLAYKQIVERES